MIESVVFDPPPRIAGKLDSPITAINRNGAVLVDIPEFIELPEGMCMHGARSVVRLKRIEGVVDAGMEQGSLALVGGVRIADREHDPSSGTLRLRSGIRKQVDQIPGELIKSRTKAIDEISDSEGDVLGCCTGGNYEEVLSSIGIVLFDNRVRVAFDPISELRLSRLEVKVCPSGFHVAIRNDKRLPRLVPGEPCRNPGCLSHISHPCEGCGRIGGRYPGKNTKEAASER